MAKKKKSYGSGEIPKAGIGPLVFIALAVAIPILLFGLGAVFKFFTSPIVNGKVSVWWIIIGVLIFMMIQKRTGGSRRQLPPGYM